MRLGGDPGNVTIFGQSGGGAKVAALMAMPSAAGLFHKAVAQSAAGALRGIEAEDGARLAAAVLKQLNLGKSEVARLHEVPVGRLIEAMMAATATFPATPPGRGPLAGTPGWGATVDGVVLPRHPFDPDAPAISKQVPLLVGTVLNESSPSQNDPEAENVSEDRLRSELDRIYGTSSGEILAAARRVYPAAKPVELLALIERPRTNAILQAERKMA